MLEELVVARLEDPAVELEVRGEVGRLVVYTRLHRVVGGRDRRYLVVRRPCGGQASGERLDGQANLRRLLVQLLVVRRLVSAS